MHHKINLVVHPSQTPEGDFKPNSYGQMYFLDPNEAAKDLCTYLLDHSISHNLMNLLKEILQDTNDYDKGTFPGHSWACRFIPESLIFLIPFQDSKK